uniref:Elongation of very long chain fatty acids protein n=1 Tax=Caligus clemensi TaxID=344056 RepID=C1C1R1_CALCM|nr:Elongation of very long chain fatty acids protein AAEL008004 [Caligus clemensi]
MVGLSSAEDLYDYAWSQRDKRVDDWALMSSMKPTLLIIATYLAVVKVIAPAFMKNRKAFQLKWLMRIYNLFQVLFSLWLFYYGMSYGWATHYNWVCQPVEMDTDPNSNGMLMAEMVWWYFFSKFTEFMDTLIFVLRKKNNQVSFLHIFHHSSMPFFTWILLRWAPGGHETFGGVLNTLVHVFMYAYYLLASFGPVLSPYLWWKKHLTTMQILQFVAVIAKSSMVFLGVVDCGFPWQISLMSLSVVIPFIGLFFNYFHHQYSPKMKKETPTVDHNGNLLERNSKKVK